MKFGKTVPDEKGATSASSAVVAESKRNGAHCRVVL